MFFAITIQLNCFTDNTTVVLSKQYKSAIFAAQLLIDDTKSFEVCQSMFGHSYNIQLIFGSYVYDYPSSLVMSGNLSLTFPCTDTLNNCDVAFAATQVSFRIVFPETNILVEDAVSTFKIDLYNRLDCLQDTKIIYDQAKQEMQIGAITGNCKVQIRQSTDAIIKILVYPDLVISKNISLSSVTQISDIFANLILNCDNDFVGTEQRICHRMLQQFVKSFNNKAELTLSLPAIIPDGSAVYSRESEFQLFAPIEAISSSFVNYFDCFTSQQAVLFTNQIRLTYEINTSAVYCSQPFEQFIGDSDHSIRTIRVTDIDGTFVEFKAVTNSKILQVTRIWMECAFDLLGEQQCQDNIQRVLKMKEPHGIISREFLNGDTLVKQVQRTILVRGTRHASSNVSLNQSHVCLTTSNNGEENGFYQVKVDLMIGTPRLQPTQHTQTLSLKGQIVYPGIQYAMRSYGIYCFQIQLTQQQQQFYNMMMHDTSQVTGIVNFMSDIPIDKIKMQLVSDHIDYMYVLSATLVLSSVVWYILQQKLKIQ
ncbi:Conserved_hypothetical protein [Hexamita inflata]|uniref:Uncharacterized protein n=1 Tax=Hexamita inflata TaxID=28002 RepID=A0AA86QAD1_9EUKA|nr:Conserved hypothetical protein [Hexamita inflata]